jgi:hypothetical protein
MLRRGAGVMVLARNGILGVMMRIEPDAEIAATF